MTPYYHDYYATLKIQQGRLRKAIKESGLSILQVAEKAGITRSLIYGYLNFREPTRQKRTGEWRISVLKICKCLGYEPSEIFPEHLQYEVPTNRISEFVEKRQLCGYGTKQLNPREELEMRDTEGIEKMMNVLNDTEKNVIIDRFYKHKTLTQTAKHINRSNQRVRQIEQEAIEKLQIRLHEENLQFHDLTHTGNGVY